jgi:hypothetical protein
MPPKQQGGPNVAFSVMDKLKVRPSSLAPRARLRAGVVVPAGEGGCAPGAPNAPFLPGGRATASPSLPAPPSRPVQALYFEKILPLEEAYNFGALPREGGATFPPLNLAPQRSARVCAAAALHANPSPLRVRSSQGSSTRRP